MWLKITCILLLNFRQKLVINLVSKSKYSRVSLKFVQNRKCWKLLSPFEIYMGWKFIIIYNCRYCICHYNEISQLWPVDNPILAKFGTGLELTNCLDTIDTTITKKFKLIVSIVNSFFGNKFLSVKTLKIQIQILKETIR